VALWSWQRADYRLIVSSSPTRAFTVAPSWCGLGCVPESMVEYRPILHREGSTTTCYRTRRGHTLHSFHQQRECAQSASFLMLSCLKQQRLGHYGHFLKHGESNADISQIYSSQHFKTAFEDYEAVSQLRNAWRPTEDSCGSSVSAVSVQRRE
jgi:hypothetical protein